MDNTITSDAEPLAEKFKSKNIENTETDFQTYIYELFDKNGIINDLRAHLRGHIVNVLKTARTGDPPPCQKNFTQRLEPRYQSLNMLLADYLLRMEFNYTLSVFVSEIPLSNMMFDFSKSLLSMGPKDDVSSLHFDNSDIWNILNSLGIKLDSQSVCHIAHMYKSEHVPLLLCIMRCLLMGDPQEELEADNQSEDITTRSIDSALVEGRNRDSKSQRACQHQLHCRSCRQREIRLKEKYRSTKSSMAETLQSVEKNSVKLSNSEALMKNINLMEKTFIVEMFQQLKAVYEAEVELVREEEKKKTRHNMAGQLILLQNKKDQLEASFEARHSDLERTVRDKKRFLWGMARDMRSQHARLVRAVRAVRGEGRKLNDKEEDLEKQVAEAEATLKKRGDEIRTQISNELSILVQHLEYMKLERNAIAKERQELDNLKLEYNLTSQEEKQDLHLQYDKIHSDLSILKKYLETTKSETKIVTESCTNTEINSEPSKVSLNNTQVVERFVSEIPSSLKNAPNQVVNDLKKMKNVNFIQFNTEECHRRASSASTVDAGRNASETETHERREDDAEVLREFARQQGSHIASLTAAQSRLRSELAAARRTVRELRSAATATRTEPFYVTLQRAGAAPHSSPGGSGGGEQLLALPLPARAPRVVLPGDTLPFVGVVGERSEARRQLISQWRATRRGSHAAGVSKSRPQSPVVKEMTSRHRPASAEARIDTTPKNRMSEERQAVLRERIQQLLRAYGRHTPKLQVRNRDKSPRTLLKEAKARLRNKDTTKPHQPREKSPSSVLREARLRLKKLEIEAEAVERSYRHFRERRGRRTNAETEDERESKQSTSDNLTNEQHSTMQEFSTAFTDFTNNCNAHFRNRNTARNLVSPIPQALKDVGKENRPNTKLKNYLETPITEFRKLYRTPQRAGSVSPVKSNTKQNSEGTDKQKRLFKDYKELKREVILKTKKVREAELQILKQNINQMYNLNETASETEKYLEDTEVHIESSVVNLGQNNNSNLVTTNEIKAENHGSTDILVFVESSIASHEISKENTNDSQIVSEMTIIIAPDETGETDKNEQNEHGRRSRSRSPEQEAKLTRNDVLEAICNHHNYLSEGNSKEAIRDYSQDGSDWSKNSAEYLDDFSADVDNYNKDNTFHNADGMASPTSMPTDDDAFWGTN